MRWKWIGKQTNAINAMRSNMSSDPKTIDVRCLLQFRFVDKWGPPFENTRRDLIDGTIDSHFDSHGVALNMLLGLSHVLR